MAFHSTWSEITPEEAKKVWKTHAVFAYDESHQVDWQLNVEDNACDCKIDEAVENGALIFVENQFNINPLNK